MPKSGDDFLQRSRIVVLGLFILLLTACNSSNQKPSDDQLLIYTSIYPIQFLVEKITGEHAVVTSIYPPGVDAHTYEPTSREITQIAKGDALIFLGAGMESFAENAADALQNQGVLFVELGENEDLFSKSDKQINHNHNDLDPHIWLDPLRMIKMGEQIKNELITLTPENENQYNENFAQLEQALTELDHTFEEILEAKEKKQIIVTHAAYGYWEERYGIEQIAISGISSSDEPSQKELTSIAQLAEEEQLEFVIFEQTGTNRLGTIIQEYIHAEKRTIHNLETLTEEDIKNDENYISLMEKNLNVLDEATK